MKLITTASDPNHPGWLQFKRSLDHFGWDYHLIVHEYTNYNDKIIAFYKYLVEHRHELTHFVYADSYDSFVLAPQKELEDKYLGQDLLYSIEKACWPYPEWAVQYPDSPYPCKYLNGGGFCGSVEVFIKMYESNPIATSGAMNDQVWAANEFLTKREIKLDRDSSIFQTMSHTSQDEFECILLDNHNRLLNIHTKTLPIIFHGNGHTKIDWIYNLLP